ncbi:Rv3235 family protein [Amycolatopsis panacis]|nr:Rv3235 family protein [Amycolatopsis panacis]
MTKHHLRLLTPGPVRRVHHRVARPAVRDLPPAGHRILRFAEVPHERHLTQRLKAILEVLAGRRPAVQIQSLVDDALFARLSAHGPLPGLRYRVGDLHVCQPSDTAIETSTTLITHGRVHAVAARFELTRTGWVCTRFHVLAPRLGPVRRPQPDRPSVA